MRREHLVAAGVFSSAACTVAEAAPGPEAAAPRSLTGELRYVPLPPTMSPEAYDGVEFFLVTAAGEEKLAPSESVPHAALVALAGRRVDVVAEYVAALAPRPEEAAPMGPFGPVARSARWAVVSVAPAGSDPNVRGGWCAPSPWFVATAAWTDLPPGVVATPNGAAAWFENPTPTPLVFYRDEGSPSSVPLGDVPWGALPNRVPVARVVAGVVSEYFASGVPVEGQQSLRGWQVKAGVSRQLVALPPPTRSPTGAGRPADVVPPEPEPFTLGVWFGRDVTLGGTYSYTLNPDYDPDLCAR